MPCRMGIQRLLTLVGVLMTAHGGQARAQEASFFGSNQGFEVQPEVDVYWHVAEDARLLLQVQGTSIPSQDYGSIAVGAYGDWMLAPFFRNLVSPDQALTRALNLRLGVRYVGTLNPGTIGSSQRLAIQLDVTPRYFLPWSILLSNRNRLQAQWQLGEADSSTLPRPVPGAARVRRGPCGADTLRERGVALAGAASDVGSVPDAGRVAGQRALVRARADHRGELLDGDVPPAVANLAPGARGHLVSVFLGSPCLPRLRAFARGER
jgi:hypothetical protein